MDILSGLVPNIFYEKPFPTYVSNIPFTDDYKESLHEFREKKLYIVPSFKLSATTTTNFQVDNYPFAASDVFTTDRTSHAGTLCYNEYLKKYVIYFGSLDSIYPTIDDKPISVFNNNKNGIADFGNANSDEKYFRIDPITNKIIMRI